MQSSEKVCSKKGRLRNKEAPEGIAPKKTILGLKGKHLRGMRGMGLAVEGELWKF